MSEHHIRKAVIPVAGIGTRMLPATKAQRKEMFPVAGKPLLQYSIEEAAASGIEIVVLVTGERSASLLEHFQRDRALEALLKSRGQLREAELVRSLPDLVTFCTVEQPSPRGLGHAVYCAVKAVGDEPFALLLPDVIIDAALPCTAQLVDVYHQCGGSVIAVQRLEPCELDRHGVVKPLSVKVSGNNNAFRITGLVEKPRAGEAPSNFGVCGRYVLHPSIFSYIEKNLANDNTEIHLTDALDLMAKETPIYGVQFVGEHFDAGDRLGFLKANLWLTLNDKEASGDVKRFLKESIQKLQ